jgi:hypothetical protein
MNEHLLPNFSYKTTGANQSVVPDWRRSYLYRNYFPKLNMFIKSPMAGWLPGT